MFGVIYYYNDIREKQETELRNILQSLRERQVILGNYFESLPRKNFILKDSVQVRFKPDTTSSIIEVLSKGKILYKVNPAVDGRVTGFSEIQYSDSNLNFKSGIIQTKYIRYK